MHPRHRSFIRHPIEIPIEVAARDESEQQGPLRNVSYGGLAFHAGRAYQPGTLLSIRIQTPEEPVQLAARVVWCQHASGQPPGQAYEIGVAFEDQLEAFRVRMVEQICQIERYRLSVLGCEGRQLTSEEAAREWIEHYGDNFYPQ